MDIKAALTQLANDIKREILRRMSSDIGVNKRTGVNTLVGSDLYYSVDVYPKSDTTIVFQIADYYEYVVKGWKRTHRGKGSFQEYLINIRNWIRKKNIRWGNLTENQMVWVLAKRMFGEENYTIAARPFINYDPNDDVSKILPFLDDFFDKWADWMFDKITEDLDKYFK